MKKIKYFLSLFQKNFLTKRFVIRNFLMLAGIFSVFFLAFVILIFRRSRDIIEDEFISVNRYSTEVIANSVEDYLMDVRYIAATLDTNTPVKTYFHSDNPEEIITGVYQRISEHLSAYVNSFNTIESIYLYSEKSKSIITANERVPLSYFSDDNWMEYLTEKPSKYTIYPRAKNGSYPFVLTLMKQIDENDYSNAIVINISLGNLSNLIEIKNNNYQEVFIVTNDSKILFKYNQQKVLEEMDSVPELAHFDPNVNSKSILVSREGSPYTFTQIKSPEYDWNYIVITNLQEYTYKLSDSRAILITISFILFFVTILFALAFSLHSFKPINAILNMLDNPESMVTKKSDNEIKYIAHRITSYIQTNEKLSYELSLRLDLLNETKLLALQSQINPHFLFNSLNMIHILECDALGYDHVIPKITISLSKLLRYAIESTDLVTLETELSYTDLYVSILNQRYGNKLQVEYQIETETLSAKVPKLLIQPLIENAVFHGFAKNISEGSQIMISCQQVDDNYILTIGDNGRGMTPEVLQNLRELTKDQNTPKENIGLKNVVIRMNLLYGDRFSMQIDSQQNIGSTFILQFPV